MRRRAFIEGIAALGVAWPLAARAQSTDRVRVVGILSILGPDDPEAKARTTIFEETLQQLGWSVGRNLKIETRELGGDVDRLHRYAAELVARLSSTRSNKPPLKSARGVHMYEVPAGQKQTSASC
jgi:putative tryptophan/tyrosine transport system substrate-binding protein